MAFTSPCSPFSPLVQEATTKQSTSVQWDDLPNNVLKHIISQLPINPLGAGLICRRMQVVGRELRDEQLWNQRIYVAKLAHACALSAINPFCIEVLCNYDVNLASICARTDEEIREEFNVLLDGRLSLLQHPEELNSCLRDLLSDNSWWVVGNCCVAEEEELEQMKEEGRQALQKMGPPPILKFSDRIRSTVDVLAFIKSHKGLLFGEDCMTIWGKHLLRILALPPVEAVSLIRERIGPGTAYQDLFLSSPSFIPSGIGSMNWVRELKIVNAACTSLPESAEKLNLYTIEIIHPSRLERLPTLRIRNGIRKFTFEGSGQEWQKLANKICDVENLGLRFSSEITRGQVLRLPLPMDELKILEISSCSQDMLESISSSLHLDLLSIRVGENFTQFPKSLLNMHTLMTLMIFSPNPQLTNDPVLRQLREHGVEVYFNRV